MSSKRNVPSDATTVDRPIQPADGARHAAPVPGVVVVFSGGSPVFGVLPLENGALEISRTMSCGAPLDDPCLSRRHARVELRDGTWTVTDHQSRNGTGLDGERITRPTSSNAPRLIRAGDTLMIPLLDVTPFFGSSVEVHPDRIVGPTLASALVQVARASQTGDHLHLHGESGAGKELAARTFHGGRGPFVAVNCATIPEPIAERLLFGTRRGAYSGATDDADGYLQSAHSGTLFLDEIAELHLSVQAKLLRVLETHEVLALGASKARPIDLRFCSATHRSLRAEVGAGRFREDLFFRIARPEVELPALRDRREDTPWLIDREIRSADPQLRPSASLVELCLLRAWPGNVRELRVEIAAAARLAAAEPTSKVEARHLAPSAGQAFASLEQAQPTTSAPSSRPAASAPDRHSLEQALQRAEGNISRAAREMGVHRTQLRRWLIKHELAGASDPAEPDDSPS